MDYHVQVIERLARLETKIDNLDSKFDSHESDISDHEARIRKIEKAMWLASGTAAAGGGLLGAFMEKLTG